MIKGTLYRIFTWPVVYLLLLIGCAQGPSGSMEAVPETDGRHQQVQLFEPLRPIAELRIEALKAHPPVEEGDFFEPDLVEVAKLDPTVKLDVRYATSNNFMGEVMYESPRVFLQRPVAEALLDAHRTLKEKGYGVVLFDGYRPWYVTKIFWDATPDEKKEFVADPARGSRHNRGAAIDLSLYDLSSGKLVAMPSGYDETTERAGIEYDGADQQSTANRDLLMSTMRLHGFEPIANEWWHYDYKSWSNYPIMNIRFEDINRE